MTTVKKTKNIPILRFPGFFGEWEEKKLESLVKNIGGTALEKFVNENGTHKFISIGNYSIDGKYIDNGQRIILNDKTKTKLLNKGDLAMVLNDKTASGDIIGSSILINEDNKFIYNQRTERLICEKDFDSFFAWYLLNSNKFRKRIVKMAQGGTQIYVNFPSVKKEKICIPKKKEQQKIASFFGAVDEWVENLRGQKESLEKYKKGMMQKIFSQEIRFKDESGKNFTEWEEKKLGEVCDCLDNKRKPLNDSERNKMKGKIPYWGANKVMDYVNDFLFDGTIVLLAEDGGNFAEFKNKPIAQIYTGKCWVNNHAHVLTGKEKFITSIFLYYSLVHKDITAYVNGGTRSKLNKSDMLTIKLKVPHLFEQQKITEFLGSIDKLIESKQQQMSLAEQWKKGLMQGLFV